MINIDRLKAITKNIKQKDVCIDYLKRNIARSKDWGNIVASYSVLREYMQKVYSIEI